MAKTKKSRQRSFKLTSVVIVVLALAVVVLGGWRIWDATDHFGAAGQKSVKVGNNAVLDADKGTSDLVSFLKSDYTGCRDDSGQYKILQELPGRFAKMGYGCSNTKAYIFAQFKDGKWSLISPTDQFLPDGTPSCEMVYSHSISKQIAPKCAILGSSTLQNNTLFD